MSDLYVFDRNDLETRVQLRNLETAATTNQSQTLYTQCGQIIKRVSLVELREGNRSYLTMPQYGLLTEGTLTSFETENGQKAQLINNQADLISNQDTKDQKSNGFGMYVLNGNEVTQMIQAGLYDDPEKFMKNLNDSLRGTTYLRQDYVSMQKLEVDIPGGNQVLTVYSADVAREQQRFSAKTLDNTFTFLLNNGLAEMTNNRTQQKEQAERNRLYAEQVAAAKQVSPNSSRHLVKVVDAVDLDSLQTRLTKLADTQNKPKSTRKRVSKRDIKVATLPTTPVETPDIESTENAESEQSSPLETGAKRVTAADDPFATTTAAATTQEEKHELQAEPTVDDPGLGL